MNNIVPYTINIGKRVLQLSSLIKGGMSIYKLWQGPGYNIYNLMKFKMKTIGEGKSLQYIGDILDSALSETAVTDLVFDYLVDRPMPYADDTIKAGVSSFGNRKLGDGVAYFQYDEKALRDIPNAVYTPVTSIIPSSYEQIIQPLIASEMRDRELYEGDIRENMRLAAQHQQYLNSQTFKTLQYLKEGLRTSVHLYGTDKVIKFIGHYFNSSNLYEAANKSYYDLGRIDNDGTIMPIIQNTTCTLMPSVMTPCVEVTNLAFAIPKAIDAGISDIVSICTALHTWIAGDQNAHSLEAPHTEL